MWEEAINEFKANPIFGVGLGNFAGGVGYFPHNILLEILAELGIVGLFMFSWMFYLNIKKAIEFIRANQDRDVNILMKISIVLLIYHLTEAMFSGHITNQTQLFMSMAMVVSVLQIREKGEILWPHQGR
jgi:O-antigen ligase